MIERAESTSGLRAAVLIDEKPVGSSLAGERRRRGETASIGRGDVPLGGVRRRACVLSLCAQTHLQLAAAVSAA